MRRLMMYTGLLAVFGLIYACGGNQQQEGTGDMPMEQDMPLNNGEMPRDDMPTDSVPTDSLDSAGQALPTPPMPMDE